MLIDEKPEDWTIVPNVGAYVEADHPITVLNPTKAFEVKYVRCHNGRWAVRGTNTCWFSVSMVRPATPENARAAEDAAQTMEIAQ